MRKSVFAFAALCTAAGAAHAQSSVTLYGAVDSGLTFTSNAKGGHLYNLNSGTENPNRWGLTGTEDLGGGLAAIFTIEGGFNIGNGTLGQNGTEFGRQAFVGLTNQYGTVTLGRQVSGSFYAVGSMEAGGDWAAAGTGYGAHPGDADNLDTSNRIANAVKFKSQTYRGFTFTGTYSFGGKAGDFSQNSIYDLAATYVEGPVRLAAGYLFVKDPNYSFWGNKANDSTTASNITSPVISGYASAGAEQIVSAGASYTVGPAIVGLIYSNTQFQELVTVNVAGLNAPARSFTGTATFNTGEVNLKYRISPALMLGAAYFYTRNSGADNSGTAHYQQVDLGAIYSISARTSLYAVAVWQAAAGTDSTGGRAVAAITGATPSSTTHQVVATIGMSHRF
jgi:predicted porin